MNYAYLDRRSKRALRRAMLKALALPGRQVPFVVPDLPIAYGWGVGGMAATAALLTPEDRLKVVDHGADDTVNALNIKAFFQKTADVRTTDITREASLIQTRQRVPEAQMREGQILIYQVPRPDPLRGFINDPHEARQRHASHDYGIVYGKLFENWLQQGETALGYDHPVIVEGGAMMSPSPVPAQDNARMHDNPAIQIFGAARERRIYALPAYSHVQSLSFDDLAFLPKAQAASCVICGGDQGYLDNLGTAPDPKWVCSDGECCQARQAGQGGDDV